MELYFTTLYKRENIDPLLARKILFENLLEKPKYGKIGRASCRERV